MNPTSEIEHDFGRGPAVRAFRYENGAIVAVSAQVDETVKLGEKCSVGAAVLIGPESKIGARAFIGRESRLMPFTCIANDGIVGPRNEGHLHAVVPGGPYVVDAHFLRDGTLWFTVGCESHSLEHWEAHWEEIAARNKYQFSPVVVALFPVARMLVMPAIHAP